MPSADAANKYILAIDHGTSGIKAALYSARGEMLAFEYEKTQTLYLPGGGVEQNPEEWWNALVSASRKLVNKGLVPVDDIVAVCCSSTFSSTVAVDKSGKHIANSLTWMDSRAAPYIKEIIGRFPSVIGYNIFKTLKWINRTGGGPQLSGKDDIAHVLLWQKAFPEIYHKAYMFLPSKDYLNLRLSGEFAASFDSIMLFWVTDTRDINNIKYDDALIKELGIDKAKLPPLKRAIDVIGTIKPEVADEIGLSRKVKIVSGSPDHQSACMGSGAIRDYEGHIYIGTSSWIQCVIPFKKTDPFHSIASLPTSIPGKYYAVNEQDIAGGCLSFLVDNILYNENALKISDPPDEVYKYMDEIADSVPAGSEKLIFTPWLNGERTPVDDTNLRGGLYNLSLIHNSNHIIRAVFEGVAFNNKWALTYVEKFIGRRMEELVMIGGGAKSKVWCQIFADVLDRRIRQPEDPISANSRGAAFIASVGLGFIDWSDIPGLVKMKETFVPNPANRAIYDEIFKAFLSIYKNNKKMFARLNR